MRADEGFDIEKHKHIFVYGLLGYVLKYSTAEELGRFIKRYFLSGDYTNFLNDKKYNLRTQLFFLIKMKYGKNSKIEVTTETDNRYTVRCMVNDMILASHTSKSREYAVKKVIRKSLGRIAENDDTRLRDEEYFLALEQQKADTEKEMKKQERQLKHQALLEKQKEKKTQREERRKKLEKESLDREIKRREAKIKKKERMMEVARLKLIQSRTPMSARKRRHLEDKMK